MFDMDCISQLADEILQHILSFLETREAATTSLLSKRWRYLWVYAPALDFDNFEERNIRSAMVNHKSLTLQRFRISTYWFEMEDLDGFSAEHWSTNEPCLRKEFLDELIRANLSSRKYKVRELQLILSNYHKKPYRLPTDIFSSRNLRILKLFFCYIGSRVGTVNLSGVETLSLSFIHSSAGAFSNLISSCCNVKNLELSYCEPVEVDLSISLQELRKMVVKDNGLRNITIDAPKLQYVKLQSRFCDLKFSIPRSLNLMYAELELSSCDDDMQIRNLAHEVGRSKVVKLRNYHCKELPLDFFEECPPCYNVKELVVDVGFGLTSTLSFLKLFPNLEDLTIVTHSFYGDSWIEEDYDMHDGGGGEDLQHVSLHCLKYSLKRIKVEDFRAHKVLVKLVKFLAENAVVLETMNLIKCHGYLSRLLEMRNNLITRKASKFAQIICT